MFDHKATKTFRKRFLEDSDQGKEALERGLNIQNNALHHIFSEFGPIISNAVIVHMANNQCTFEEASARFVSYCGVNAFDEVAANNGMFEMAKERQEKKSKPE